MDRQQLEALAREIRAAARSKGMGLRRLTAASGVAHTTILRMVRIWEDLTGWTLLPENCE